MLNLVGAERCSGKCSRGCSGKSGCSVGAREGAFEGALPDDAPKEERSPSGALPRALSGISHFTLVTGRRDCSSNQKFAQNEDHDKKVRPKFSMTKLSITKFCRFWEEGVCTLKVHKNKKSGWKKPPQIQWKIGLEN